jgi:hypothetical protein
MNDLADGRLRLSNGVRQYFHNFLPLKAQSIAIRTFRRRLAVKPDEIRAPERLPELAARRNLKSPMLKAHNLSNVALGACK